jgi:hypothetical protein
MFKGTGQTVEASESESESESGTKESLGKQKGEADDTPS